MNIRTIQHPGVETREIDLSEYFASTPVVNINNAYVMGFTSKGPIYNFSWITSEAEYLAIYGEPTNEAERYLYYAVQSILSNGGYPIVSRMPYDNKQCKVYKGLSLSYGTYDGELGVYDTINSSASTILPLNEINSFVGDKMQDHGLSSYILPKFAEVEVYHQKPVGYLLWQDLSILSATIEDVIYLASAAKFRNYSIAEDLSTFSENLSENFLNETIRDYIINNYSNTNFTSLYNGFKLSLSTDVINDLTDGYGFNFNHVQYNPVTTAGYVYNGITFKSNVMGTTGLLSTLSTKMNNVFTYTTPGYEVDPIKAAESISGTIAYAEDGLLSGFMAYGSDSIAISFECDTTVSTAIPVSGSVISDDYELTFEGSYTMGSTDDDNGSMTGTYYQYVDSQVVLSAGNTTTGDYCFTNCEITLRDMITNLCPTFNDVVDYGDSEPYYRGDAENFIDYCYSVINSDGQFEVTDVESFFGDASNRTIQDNQALSSVFTINGIAPSAVGVYYSAVSGLYTNVAGGATDNAGFPSSVTLSTTIADLSVADSEAWADVLADDTYGLYDMAKVYNDPMFYEFEEEGLASIDANLLLDPAVAYENMLAIVSKDVELTNDQYDGLVATNNFNVGPDDTYGDEIDKANFVIVDKLKTLTSGQQNNEGYFVTIIDPFDALKVQRLLVNPFTSTENYESISDMAYWGINSDNNWESIYTETIDTLDTLKRVKNADGIWVGEPGTGTKTNIMDSWSTPLSGAYDETSISKILMKTFGQIPIADSASDSECCIDKTYSTHVVVAVCRTSVNPADGKITVTPIETFFGSLFDEFDANTGNTLYIGHLINQTSNYIEFYRNKYEQPSFGGSSSKEPYNKTTVNQVYLKGSTELKNAADFVGIDTDDYDINQDFNVGDGACFSSVDDANAYVLNRIGDETYPPATGKYYFLVGDADDPEMICYKELEYVGIDASGDYAPYTWSYTQNWKKPYSKFVSDCSACNVHIFDKKATCLYNLYQNAYFTSFSQKEAQKVIANTTGQYSPIYGVSTTVASNFITDMDRCIRFIDNCDEIPIYFVADAGLSTIAQFVDNVNWDAVNEKMITQLFDPDNDPDLEDHYITSFDDVATWKKVITKLDYISSSVRKDCMTIIDAPRQLTIDGQAPKLRPSAWDNTFDEEIGTKLRFISGLNSSYTAGYYNWCRVVDSFTGIAFWLPPTSKLIGNLMFLNAANLPWLAPAGTTYGKITGIQAISHNPNSSEEDQIYLKNWNYIKQYPREGFIVEGQKTTLTRKSAFNRINVRTLFLDIERYLTNVGRGFRYRVNNAFTRQEFVNTIKSKLEDYVTRQGIVEYLIKCDEQLNTPEVIDANELRAIIYIKPGRLIEYIVIDCVATKSGAVLSEITY